MLNYAWVHNNEIYVKARYSVDFVDDCRAIEGRRWCNDTKTNVFPMSASIMVKELARKWAIQLPPEVNSLPEIKEDYISSGRPYNVDVADGKVNICFDYDPILIQTVRSYISNVFWDGISKQWIAPIEAAYDAFIFAGAFDLLVSPAIAELANKDGLKRQAMVEASSALDADIEIPGIAMELLPYQKAGVAYIKKVRKAILADQPGLGKTVQALAAIVSENALPAVIVCPNSLKLNWAREIDKFFPGHKTTVLSGTKSEEIEDSDFLVINYDILYDRVNDIKSHGYISLVVDESHAIKNGKKRHVCPRCKAPMRSNAKNCSSCSATSVRPLELWTVKRTDAVMKLARELSEQRFVILLTGTPITNRPMELVPQLEAIQKLDSFGGAWRFKNRYAPSKNVATNSKELNEKLRSMCFVRRVKKDVYGELPPLREATQYLSPSDEIMSWYRGIELDAIEYFANRARELAAEAGEDEDGAYWEKKMRLEPMRSLVEITALRTAIAKVKKDSAIQWIDNFLESSEDEKVIVFAEHIEFVEELAKYYGGIAVKIRGGVSVDDRQAAVDRFQTDPSCRLFIANMQSASEGLTLTAASDVVFCELGWTPAIHDQCVSRAYGRANDLHGATAWYLLAPNTIDESTFQLIASKREIVDAVTEGFDIVSVNESMIGELSVMLAKRGLDATGGIHS